MADVVSVVPSVSIASHTTLITGAPPSEHRIPGHRWMSLESRKVRNYLRLGASRINSDISLDVSTLYEQNGGGHSVQALITRGAQTSRRLFTQDPRALLDAALELVVAKPAGTFVVWLPRGDSVAHRYGPDSDEAREEMTTACAAIGRFLRGLQAAHLLDNATVTLVPDHGHRTVRQSIALPEVVASALPSDLPVSFNSAGWRRANRRGVQVLTSGDAAAYVYGPEDASPDFTVAFAQELGAAAGISLAACRLGSDTHLFRSRVGTSTLTVTGPLMGDYEIVSGDDPLRLGASGRITTDHIDAHSSYPGFLGQYLDSYVDGRSADILVFAGEYGHFGWGPRVGWRFGFHRGSHGGPTADEVFVTAVFSGPHARPVTQPLVSKDVARVTGLVDCATVARTCA